MPLVGELTETFLAMFSKSFAKKLIDLLASNKPYGADRPTNRKAIAEAIGLVLAYKESEGANYEDLLKEIEDAAKGSARTQPDRDSFSHVGSVLYGLIHLILVAYQEDSYRTLYPINAPRFARLKELLSTQGDWFFSLNHDLCLECLAIDHAIPITYGDRQELEFPLNNLPDAARVKLRYRLRSDFVNQDMDWIRNQLGINLVRLHGGLSEYLYGDGQIVCNPLLSWDHSSSLIEEFVRIESMAFYHAGTKVPGSGRDRTVTGPDGTLDILSRAMLTGGRKYSYTTNEKPGEEKLKLFADVLRTVDELVVIGYGFADSHINYRISNAMVLNEALALCVIDPVRRPRPDLLKQFEYGRRLRGAQSRAAEWFGFATDGKWDSALIQALKDSRQVREPLIARVKAKFAGT